MLCGRFFTMMRVDMVLARALHPTTLEKFRAGRSGKAQKKVKPRDCFWLCAGISEVGPGVYGLDRRAVHGINSH